jgi:NAD(P)-dependent dehydrogenase (short-subunit alcohol dehydrogenase family)
MPEAARQVVARHGRIDGWVQFADARAGGGLRELPPEQVDRVLDAGLLGAVRGARAVLPLMAAQGSGVFVVVASVHGQVARPFAPTAGMTGAALRVLAAALRQELRLGGVRGVAVTAVLAPELEDSFPTGDAERVAATVLRQLRRPRLEKVAGGPVAKAVVHGHALVPGLTEWLVARRSRSASRG